MKTTGVTEEQITIEQITTTINQVRELWKQGVDNRLKLGEMFHNLRSQVDRYQKNHKDGLSYTAAVAQTGVPRGTAENYRSMWEAKEACGVSGDLFLILCEKGVNLATLKAKSGEAFKGAISQFLPALSDVSPINVVGVKKLAEDLKAAFKAVWEPYSGQDEDVSFGELDGSFDEWTQHLELYYEELAQVKSRRETEASMAGITEANGKLIEISVRRMRKLVEMISPFVLEGNDEAVESYIKKFSEMPLSLQKQTYGEAKKLLKSLSDGLKSVLEAEEVKA